MYAFMCVTKQENICLCLVNLLLAQDADVSCTCFRTVRAVLREEWWSVLVVARFGAILLLLQLLLLVSLQRLQLLRSCKGVCLFRGRYC